MREHLYRGKRVDNGDWVYGFYWNRGKFAHCIKVIDENGNLIGDYEVISKTICEFTGLTDKNGNKIFEEDILKARHNSHPYLVSYEECRFKIEDDVGNRVKMTQDAINWLEVELIGNIHDNPELLEKTK